MNIEKLKTINSTNPVVANAIKACIEKNACEDQVVENYGLT